MIFTSFCENVDEREREREAGRGMRRRRSEKLQCSKKSN